MKKIILVFLAAFGGLYSQSFEILSVDPAAYPRMKAQVVVKDATKQEVRNYNLADIRITDAGKVRPVIKTECQPNLTMFSVILTLDVTGSMTTNINALEADNNKTPPQRGQIAKNTAKTFLQQLPDGRFEAAFTTFANDSYLLKDFTTNKQEIIDTLAKVGFNGPTNYNRGFLGNNNNGTGACDLADRAKYKPVIIFITDGAQDLNKGPIEVNKILPRVQSANATVYCISIGKEEASDAELNSIASGTGGKYYKNISDESTIATIYQNILSDANNMGDPVPCTIEWETDCAGGDLLMEYLPLAVSAAYQYTIPDAVKPHLDIVKRTGDLALNTTLNSTQEIPYTVTSQKNTTVIKGISSSDPRYKIDWKGNTLPITLTAGQSINVAVDYTPDLREFSFSDLVMESSACSGNDMKARGGYIFAEDIVFDQVDQGQTDTKDFSQRFCNYTDEEIIVSTIKVTGGANQADFGITPQLNVKVSPGECIAIRASFAPKDQGDREADYTVTLSDGKTFSAKMRGGGSGRANIAASASQVPDLNCKKTEGEFSVSVTNSGPVALEVTNVTSDNPDFQVTGPTSFTVPAASTDNTTLTVRFARSAAGTSNAEITIESNAENGEAVIDVTGVRKGVDYTVDRTEIDFGTICVNTGSPLSRTVNVTNLADFDYSADGIIKNASPQFTVTETDDLATGKAGVFTVTFEAGSNGTYTDILEITDECGELIKTVTLKGEINSPELIYSTHSISATVGSFTDQAVRVENSTAKDIFVTSASVVDLSDNALAQFSIAVQNFTIPANGAYDVIVRYEPAVGDEGPLPGKLKLTGIDPCSFVLNNIDVIGNPGLATAVFDVQDYNTQYAGNVVTIPVRLRNKQGMAASGATRIVARINVLEGLLSPMEGTPVGSEITEYAFDLDGTDNDQVFEIDFLVEAGSAFTSTTLLGIGYPQALNDEGENVAFIDYDDGIFEISPAAAELVLIEQAAFTGAPGQILDFPVKILDEEGTLQPVHNNIRVSVTVDSEVLTFENAQCIYDGASNTCTYMFDKQMDFKGSANQYDAGTVRLKAVLGSRTEGNVTVGITPLGSPFDIEAASVKFTLDKLCTDNNMTRLYNVRGATAGLAFSPNPVRDAVNIEFTNVEPGEHKISLVNTEGIVVGRIFDAFIPAAGTFEKSASSGNLNNGVYFILYETPTQKFVKSLIINR